MRRTPRFRPGTLFALTALLTTLLAAVPARAQQGFPAKPITFVVPFAAGTATDQLARSLGQAVAADAGHNILVDNKPGASGFLAAQAVAKAAADGHVVLITTNTTHAANEHLFKKLPYDPVKDFSPITALGKGGQILVVNPEKVAARSVAELVALAKQAPGKFSFGSGSSSSRVAGELFQQMAGVQLLHVPYKSNTLAMTDLLGGQIDMMITDTATGLPQVKAGKVRALGVSGRQRSALAPDVPTIDEAGVKGYEMSYWFAAYAPAGTPAPVVKKLHELLTKAARSAAAANFYGSTGTELFLTGPDELALFQAEETRKWGGIIKAAGIQPE
jgi:tripartite-type tricarboxylate transporter receptor subunit TctC